MTGNGVVMKQKKENNFLVHGGILALASILVRVIGLVYRVLMTNIIGNDGAGYYSTAYSVYAILLLLSSYSLPLAVSKMVSARIAVGKWRETSKVITVSLVFGTIVGLIFSAITYFGADLLCGKLLKSELAAIPLKWMAPTVFIMCILGVLRGFFQGMQTTIPTAVSQILEQIANAIVSVGAAAALFQYGVELDTTLRYVQTEGEKSIYHYAPAWGASGGTIGTGAGALAALIFCIVLFFLFRPTFRKNIASDRTRGDLSYIHLSKILLFTAVPVIISTASYNCIDLIDEAIFTNVLSRRGVAENAYMKTWGDYGNAFLTLIHLPVSLASGIGSALVPSIASAYAEKNSRKVLKNASLAIRVTLLIAIPCAFGMMAIGGNLAKLLYPGSADEAQKYLVAGGLAVIFFSLSTITNAILQGINHMNRPVMHAFIALAAHIPVLLLLLIVFRLDAFAVIIAYSCFGLIMSVLNMISIYRITGYLPDPVRTVALPVASSAAMVLVCFLISFVLSRFVSGRTGNLLIVLFCFTAGVIVYGILILLTGCITRSQLKRIPMGTRIIRLADRFHLLGR